MTVLVLLISFTLAMGQQGPKWVGAFFVKGKVGLKWQKADGATEYKIYRKTADGEFEVLTTTEKTQYFDLDVSPGMVYKYKIGVAGGDGAELMSTEKSVSIPGSKVGEFVAPSWSGVRVENDRIMLRWDEVSGVMAYNIYRSTTSGSGYEIIGNSVTVRHADQDNLERGTTYYYVVTALNDEFEETEYSEERQVQFGVTDAEIEAQRAAASKIHLDTLQFTFLFELTSGGEKGNMNQPAGIDMNSKGDIYVTDALNQQVNCFGNDGEYLFSFGSKSDNHADDPIPEGTFSMPYDVVVDSKDQVFVADIVNHDIQVFDARGNFVKRITVSVDEGQKEFKPGGFDVLDDGRIVVADGGNHRILIIDQDGKILKSFGKRGDKPGQFNFTGGLTVTDDGLICVVDIMNCRVQEFDLDGNFVREFGGIGQTVGSFARPKTVVYGDDGRLWVSDGLMNSVQAFTIEGEVKVAITTLADGAYMIRSPRGMMVKDGRFYLINRMGHHVLVFKIG